MLLGFESKLHIFFDRVVARLEKALGRGVYPNEENIRALFTQDRIAANKYRIKRKKVKVVGFFCMDISMWMYGPLFDALMDSEEYHPILFIAPKVDKYSVRREKIKAITKYCRENGYSFIPLKNNIFNVGQDVKKYNLDFVFFTQPYHELLCREYSYENFADSLLCSVPYAYIISFATFNYDSILHKIAWRCFFQTQDQIVFALEKGRFKDALCLSGSLGYDTYTACSGARWETTKKKIIWAPHHSINPRGWLHLSCFMDVYDYFFEIAEQYKDQIEIAFKPHPILYTALCKVWGIERTDLYYRRWKELGNGRLELGESFPLMKASDALIHDCGSFTMDYMFTGKPCAYLLLKGMIDMDFNKPGQAAFGAHYHVFEKEEIKKFIEDVVLNGNDEKKSEREFVFRNYVKPTNCKTATENVLAELNKL